MLYVYTYIHKHKNTYMHAYIRTYLHTYTYIDVYIYIFQAKRDTVAFYVLPCSLSNVMPVRPSCFDQVFLGNCGRRTYIVRGARIVSRMVQ